MTMVEQVTLALREELQKIGYGVGTINAGQLSDALARAAIEAMREPTADMVDTGRDVGPDAPYGLSETIKRWEAMIDTALGKVDA